MNGSSSEATKRDAARWAEAEAIATGSTTGSPGSRGWRSPSRRPVLVVAGVVGVLVVLGIAAGVGFGGRPHHASRSEVAGWREVVGLVLVYAGGGYLLWALVRSWRAGTYGAAWSSPMRKLSLRRRRQVGRQLRGKAPVPAHEVVVLRAAAEVLLVQNGNARPTMLGLTGVLLGQLVQSTGGYGLVSSVLLLIAALGVVVLLPRDARRLRTFLAEHPSPNHVSGV